MKTNVIECKQNVTVWKQIFNENNVTKTQILVLLKFFTKTDSCPFKYFTKKKNTPVPLKKVNKTHTPVPLKKVNKTHTPVPLKIAPHCPFKKM